MRPTSRKPAQRAGFTLMEVNLALLMMSVGLLGILALFPLGMRQGNAATSDTTQAAFASMILNAMRANAQMVTNWSDWIALTNGINLGVAISPPTTGGQKITASTVVHPITTPGTGIAILGDGTTNKIGDAVGDGYLVKGQYIEYSLKLESDRNPMIIKACLQISTRRYTDLAKTPKYATAFVYTGM